MVVRFRDQPKPAILGQIVDVMQLDPIAWSDSNRRCDLAPIPEEGGASAGIECGAQGRGREQAQEQHRRSHEDWQASGDWLRSNALSNGAAPASRVPSGESLQRCSTVSYCVWST